MGTSVVLYEIGEISKFLYQITNSTTEYRGKILHYGKIYKDYETCANVVGTRVVEEQVDWNEYVNKVRLNEPEDKIDFRHTNVDKEIVNFGKKLLVTKILDFCEENRDGNLQSLFISCALSLYYTTGLFDHFGILPISTFNSVLVDDETKEYISIIENCILKGVVNCFKLECRNDYFEDKKKAMEWLDNYKACTDESKKNFYLEKVFSYIDRTLTTEKLRFGKQVLKEIKRFDEVNENTIETLITQMINLKEDFMYANLLSCLISVNKFTTSEGQDDRFFLFLEKLDDEMRKIIIESGDPTRILMFSKGIDYADGLIGKFGYGLPYIDYLDREEFQQENYPKEIKLLIGRRDEKKSLREQLEIQLYSPYKVEVKKNVLKNSLFLIYKSRENEKEKQKALDEKKSIINEFSHTYKNMRATSLYNIATELMKEGEKRFQNYGRKLLYEYSVKKNLSRDVEMLNLRFSGEIEELNKRIKRSILAKESEASVKIDKIISDALTRCMVTLVHDGKAKEVRESFREFDLIEIRNSFENEVLLSENSKILEWFPKNVFELRFHWTEEWEKILFEDESYAALLLTDVFAELIINIFKYAEKKESIIVELTKENDCLVIKSGNRILKEVVKDLESGYGIAAKSNSIKVLNQINGRDGDSVEYSLDEDWFEIKMLISSELFKNPEKEDYYEV